MLNRLNIRGKMFLILVTISVAVFILTFIFFRTVRDVEGYTSLGVSVGRLKSSMLMLRRYEKDFLLRKNLMYKEKFIQSYQISLFFASNLDKQLKNYNYSDFEIRDYLNNLELYRDDFLTLTKVMQERGLDKNSGIYGSLSKTIDKLEEYAISLNSTSLLAKLYELRKNEKDFMLRKNLIYSKDFIENFKKLEAMPLKSNIKKKLIEYKKEFLMLVDKDVVCGLNENLGLEGKMRNHAYKAEEFLNALGINILNFEINQKNDMLKKMYFTAFIPIAIVLFLILIISNNILNSLNIFQKGLLDFFDYLNKKKKNIFSIKLNQKDEFGEMAELINKQIFQTTKFLKEEEKKLDKFASYDQLTGIYNRRKFHELFELHMNELKRYEKRFSVILIDIDDFKKVNDIYGHAVGDIVLNKFVDITKNNIRDVDVFARWGGEEFIVLLPNIGIDNAHIVSEKIRKSIEKFHDDLIGSFTISLGIASASMNDTIDSFINKADIALYKAKKNGKNKTVRYKEDEN